MLTSKICRIAPLAALCAAAVACGSSAAATHRKPSAGTRSSEQVATESSGAKLTSDPAVAKLVPASLKSKTLVVASDATYPPDEFFASNGKTIIGANVDLLTAAATVMGVKVKFVNQSFDGIIPGLTAGKYIIGSSSFTDTKLREKAVNFVDYYKAGQSFYTKASGGTSITGLAGACGHTVAVESGSIEQTGLAAQSPKCKAAGKQVIRVLTFPDQNSVNLAVSSGRAQVAFADSTVADYEVKKFASQFKLVGQAVSTEPCGFALPKSSGLGPALVAAVKVLMHDGLYEKILTKWGVQSGAIPASAVKINGATS